MVDRPGLLTPQQVARAIGVSEASVKRWCDRGLIETSRTKGGHRRLAVESVYQFLRQTGHSVIHPELLGLPSTKGHTDRILRRGKQQFEAALAAGQTEVAQQVIAGLREAGHPLASIVDHVIVRSWAGLSKYSEQQPEHSYRQHRAIEICLQLVHFLREELPIPPSTAPTALTAALDGDPNTLAVALAELILRSQGWNATSLGNLLPFTTITKAVKQHKPRLVFLNVATVRDPDRLVQEFAALHRVAEDRNASLIVAGAGVGDAEFRKRLVIDGYCPDYAALAREATL